MDNIIKIITLILGSGFFAASITALITKKNNDKNNMLKYITDERQKWRILIKEKIVELVTTTNNKTKQKIIAELQLNLNPNDEEDKKIIEVAKKFLNNSGDNKENKEKILELAANLLKHDWERAKAEASNNLKPHKVIAATVIIWIIIKRVFYDYPIVVYLRSQEYFKGIFSWFCLIIVLICIAHIILKYIDKHFEENDKYIKYRNRVFKFLGIPFRKIQ